MTKKTTSTDLDARNGPSPEDFPFGANAAPDTPDPAALRLSPDLTAGLGVRKALLTVPVRKPDKTWWVRTHPNPTHRLETAVIELKEERGETYLVAPTLWPELATESTLSPRALVTAINRQAVLFLWTIK